MSEDSVVWDYTDHAAHYDQRADYSEIALSRLFKVIGLVPGDKIADIGAGTGKLTIPMANAGYIVSAFEPNDAMRSYGVSNTQGLNVEWHKSTAEQTNFPESSCKVVTYGSSFNVIDHEAALLEARRICEPHGWVVCMWNHRDLEDPIQTMIEDIIRSHLSTYEYGSRRESPRPILESSGLFDQVIKIEELFEVTMSRDDIIDAWRSHATLSRQAGDLFQGIISEIECSVHEMDFCKVPYFTRIWAAHFKE